MRIRRLSVNRGSSLIEVLIATVVVGLVVTAIAITMSHSVRNTAQSRYREIATKLAQDAQESFRKERNRLGWNQFVSVLGGSAVYCFDAIPSTFTEEQLAAVVGVCDTSQQVTVNGVNVSFYREVNVNITGPAPGNKAEVTVTMEWEDDNLSQSLSSVQELRDWN